jgi:hypothetical protein
MGCMETLASLVLVAAQLLLQTGVQNAGAGKLERVREQTDAVKLYEEGQFRMREGRFEAAEFTFRTLLNVYPDLPLAKLAEAAMKSAAEAQQELNVRLMVRTLDLNGLGLSDADMQKLFGDREVRLAAGKAFDPRDVEQARLALTNYLAAPVRAEVRTAGPHEVDVILERR